MAYAASSIELIGSTPLSIIHLFLEFVKGGGKAFETFFKKSEKVLILGSRCVISVLSKNQNTKMR